MQKVLIANRGEIAVRIIRACRELGIASVAIYSEADKDALHAQLADEAICVGPADSAESYLNMEEILSATMVSGADAIHPGYGFLSENAQFAELCEQCNITFIGPPSEVIRKMGNKSIARETVMKANVPVVPGSNRLLQQEEEAYREAEKIGYPIMIKAAMGGGGKGMRLARSAEEFKKAFSTARREALSSFGNGEMYLEHFVEHPRHIEVQILADKYGNVIHLGERDCSIQRNHQKIIEEAPCAVLSGKLRREMGEAALRAARAAGYENAGTIEFLLDQDGQFYFMEMNTRIQVEHPVTEWVSGVDLVKEQLRIAAGEQLPITQEDLQLTGHAIECRINAEDPKKHFMPCPGTVEGLYLPGGMGVRVDTSLYAGCKVSPHYDSMLAKLIVRGDDREEAIQKLKSALGEVVIEGITTNVDYLYRILEHPDYLAGNFDNEFIERLSWN